MIKRSDLIIEKIKKELEKNDIKTLEFIYDYAKYQNMTEEEKEKIKGGKYNIISKIVNKLCKTVCYNCMRIDSYVDIIINE